LDTQSLNSNAQVAGNGWRDVIAELVSVRLGLQDPDLIVPGHPPTPLGMFA
jgi:hypothetical protein